MNSAPIRNVALGLPTGRPDGSAKARDHSVAALLEVGEAMAVRWPLAPGPLVDRKREGSVHTRRAKLKSAGTISGGAARAARSRSNACFVGRRAPW